MRTHGRILAPGLLAVMLAAFVAPSSPAGGQETIAMSGHWVVEVREPDGTAVLRREFHNELLPTNPVASLLSGQLTAGPLLVRLSCGGAGCPAPCPLGICLITEPRATFAASASTFKNLMTTSGADGLRLRGSVTVSADTNIGRVETGVATCPRTVSPNGCNAPTAPGLTAGFLSPPIAVTAGQQVLVTITITSGTVGPAPTSPAAVPRR
jgi:hypothetical protein